MALNEYKHWQGKTVYRLRVDQAVMRNYRKRPTKFVAHICVEWTRGDIWSELEKYERQRKLNDESLRVLQALDCEAKKFSLLFEELRLRQRQMDNAFTPYRFALQGVAWRDYLVRGNTLKGECRFETLTGDAVRHTVLDILKDYHRQNWNAMPFTYMPRFFKLVAPELMKYMVFDKLASSEWPVPKNAIGS